MYSDWASVQSEIQGDTSHKSVLECFPSIVGRDVASNVIRSLAQSIIRCNENGESSSLHSDADVRWTMQVPEYWFNKPELILSLSFCQVKTWSHIYSLLL